MQIFLQIIGWVQYANCNLILRGMRSNSALRSCGAEQMVKRNAARSSAWLVLHLSPTFSKLLATNPASHLATHRANFWAMQFA